MERLKKGQEKLECADWARLKVIVTSQVQPVQPCVLKQTIAPNHRRSEMKLHL